MLCTEFLNFKDLISKESIYSSSRVCRGISTKEAQTMRFLDYARNDRTGEFCLEIEHSKLDFRAERGGGVPIEE